MYIALGNPDGYTAVHFANWINIALLPGYEKEGGEPGKVSCEKRHR